jgi:hypothetical protein
MNVKKTLAGFHFHQHQNKVGIAPVYLLAPFLFGRHHKRASLLFFASLLAVVLILILPRSEK